MTIPCPNPKVEVVPHANGRADCYSVLCRVPGCDFTYGVGQYVACVSDAQATATHHRQHHRAGVPNARVIRDVEWDVRCEPCGGHRRTFDTQREAKAWLAEHLTTEHGVVRCA